MKEISTVKIPTPAIEHNRAVRMGAYTPAFPPVHREPPKVADKGKIRMGAYTPVFSGGARKVRRSRQVKFVGRLASSGDGR